jgi:hypothetical protein
MGKALGSHSITDGDFNPVLFTLTPSIETEHSLNFAFQANCETVVICHFKLKEQ